MASPLGQSTCDENIKPQPHPWFKQLYLLSWMIRRYLGRRQPRMSDMSRSGVRLSLDPDYRR